MNWFNRKKSKTGTDTFFTHSAKKVSVPDNKPVRPYEVHKRAPEDVSFNRLLFIMAVFVAVALFVRTGFVQSELVILTQNTWITENASSNATLPAVDWDEYSVRDAGVVAGDDLHLESAAHTMTQTSDDGITDTCDTENCSTGGGFNGATAVKTGTTVSGSDIGASVKLVITPSSDEFTLNLLGSYDTSDASGIVVDGNTAYIADGTAGLHLVDVTTSASPALISTYNTTGTARNVVVIGSTAYVAGNTAGLQIIDISTPSSPTLTGTYNTSGKAADVAVSGNYAYVADENRGLQIIDISTPASPTLMKTYTTFGNALGVIVSGNTAYIAEDGTGLEIVDITTATSPSLISSFATAATPSGGIFMSGNSIYITIGGSGIQIIDVSTPASPSSVGTFVTDGSAKDIAIIGNVAYVAMDTSGLAAVDISTPSAPTLLGVYDTSDIAMSIAIADGIAYLADGSSGLLIIQSGESNAYYASGTFESAVMDMGSSAYELDAIISDIVISSGISPVGLEIPATDPGLLALWHMDTSDSSDTSVTDLAGSNDGTLHATPSGTNTSTSAMWDEAGNLGLTTYTALEFDGTDDYVNAGKIGTGVKTIMFWINHGSPTSGDAILELNGSQSVSIAQISGDITTSGIQSPTIYVDGSTDSATLTSGWHHVAVVTSTGINASAVKLGRVNTGYMDGLLDEVALYNREVTANEIHKAYIGFGIKLQVAASDCSNGASNAPSCFFNTGWGDADTPFIGSDGTSNTYLHGPMALYHFDEGSGASITDVSGFGHNGTLAIGGSGNQSTSIAAWMYGTVGALSNLGGQGLSFDGTDDYVAVGDIKANIKSIEFWINHSSNTFGGVILELNATQSIVIATSNKITAAGFGSSTIYVDGSSDSAVLTPGWHHVAVVTATAVTASDVNLGRVGSQYMTGSIDEVAMYDWALSAGEIKARYNNGMAKAGALFGGFTSSALDHKQYVKYKAFMSTASVVFGPQMDAVAVGYSAFPEGAGLVSSVFDTGDASSFLTDISWSETLAGHDVRVQVATSGDNVNWNYCGTFNCSIDDWMDFTAGIGNYYTKSAESIPNSQSKNADNDRYIKYKIWLMSNDGESTPTVDDVTITHDTAHLEVFAPDGFSDSTEVRAETPFNIIVKVKDSSGNVISHHDGSRTIKLTASTAQPDTDSCLSSFTKGGHKVFSRNVVFFLGEAVIANVMLCDYSLEDSFTISAVETIGGALESTADLTISDIKSPDEKVSVTLYWDPLEDCTNFNHYEAWYGTTSNVAMGIGNRWDETNDLFLAFCSTSTTTITDLLANTKYYFKLFAIDNDGNAIALETSDLPVDADADVDIDEATIDALTEDEIDETNVPQGTSLYDVLIKLGDNHHSDPIEDARGCYKHGDVIAAVPNGHRWSKNEQVSFLIIQMYLTEDEKNELLSSEKSLDGKTIIKRRGKGIDLSLMGLSVKDGKDMEKRKKLKELLKGKKMSKKKVTKDK